MLSFRNICIVSVLIVSVFIYCDGQRNILQAVAPWNLARISRSFVPAPSGRTNSFTNILIRFYTNNSEAVAYPIRETRRLLANPDFDLKKPTVLYAHGYVELASDDSVLRVSSAYRLNGGYNTLVLDWANLGFGMYPLVAMDAPHIGAETGKALYKLLEAGLDLEGLHLVGHSMGVHIMAHASRYLQEKGILVNRLTGLDPALPGMYPPIFADHVTKSDAKFVDIIHTDGGTYGVGEPTGHADFWPNEGMGKQPGCPAGTVVLTSEDFCSHWRSWAFWSESLSGGQFLARKCDTYDEFLRGECLDSPLVHMGVQASPKLRGNFYLRTAAKYPYALGERGAA